MAWTNDSKDWDYAKPFHRIESPSYNPTWTQVQPDGTTLVMASGRGYPRGCHAPSDGPDDSVYGLIIRKIARAVPGWVSVEGEDEQEVEGRLERCFQTWTDVPLWQWHRFYDWNFHMVPAPGYTYVRGAANLAGGRDELAGTQRRVTTIESMECEWDCGAFGAGPGVMFNNAQWIWPMTGQYCWIAGRWIYDCGHATSDDKSVGLMRTEIHPVKAMATAQWEAVSFPENGNLYVPGIRFQFFASKHGGYKEFGGISATDYKFIVDLPRIQGRTAAWHVGHTPDFPLNTVALRVPHLLHKADFLTGATGSGGSVQPIIEPIPAANPDELPTQVKVTIPMTQMAGSDYYGVVIKFGWFDPDQSQARRVKRCKVKFKHIHKGNEDHDTFAEEWVVKFGVNGRWFRRSFNDVHNDTNLSLDDVPVQEFYLADTDSIYLTAHGAELDLMDDVIQQPQGSRTLRLSGVEQFWDSDIIDGTHDPEHNATNRQKLWDLCYAVANDLASTFNDQNDPLGIIDPLPVGDPGHRADNPLAVNTLNIENAAGRQVAFFTEEVGESAELAEDTNKIDYVLHYEFTVRPQLV